MIRILMLVLALTAGVACKKKTGPATIEGPGEMLMFLRAPDPKAAPQFIKGFHAPEQNAWRWTAGTFAVKLRPPFGASEKGARLRVNFTVPEPVIAKLGAVTLSAMIGQMKLDPETFSKAGPATYARDVPGGALLGESATVEFSLDKFLPAGAVDQRELGIVVAGVGFEKK
ncbi:MAG: hypothetical protein NTZ56_18560 [Acidobacteria bacterium]|nr:hypothetical protein [Acidobacteriota bacterium]